MEKIKMVAWNVVVAVAVAVLFLLTWVNITLFMAY